ncbi:O-acyltransferase like protein-like [Cylas formicarius]|uniref:O-acyltransferase like protein-like n=1 Tax=Cylas formicarius TaxID=197179 RepID=UPI00295840BF|nr:O-acyltransferase like protein-like [Cylas formicarius]
MKPFSFLAVLYFVATNCIECDEKSGFDYGKDVNETTKESYSGRNYTAARSVFGLDLQLSDDVLASAELRGKMCLKNVTKCLEEDTGYRRTTDKIYRLMTSSLPPFDLSRVADVSESCRRDSRIFTEDLKSFKLWALKMYDAAAKLPSGILNGNVNQLGDFDMCLAANLESRNVKGRYCLASIEIKTPLYSPYLAALHRLFQSHYHFKSKLEDPGHRVPKFSTINWALCVPHTCTPRDVELGLGAFFADLMGATELDVRYEVNPGMCRTSHQRTIPTSTLIATAIFVSIIVLELMATLYDVYAFGEKDKWITSFSFKRNLQTLTKMTRSSGDIEAVHGIRMLNAVLLLLAHKSMALFFLPYVNRTECVEFLARPFTVLGRAASLYTDPFIMISGTLTSYALVGKLNKTGRINVLREYVSRLYRIVPTFAALIAFCTFILPWLDDGPMWNSVVTHHSDICKRHWWRNLLFIHNYFGFEDMCLTHTHHLGIDTQLFAVSPIFIYCLWRWPKNGSLMLILVATLSTLARFYITYTKRLANYVHFGTSIRQLFDTADNMYILPAHRVTVYIMGIFLGYLLRNYGHINLTKTQLRIGNTVALLSFLVSYFGAAFMGKIDYVYDPLDAAWYAAVSPILWVGAFAWIIFTSQLGYKGLVGKFFCMPVWTLWTKISYTVYLTQFPVFFYNIGTTRSVQHYGFFTTILNLQEYSWVIALSVVLSLVFEMPFQNIRSVLLENKDAITMRYAPNRKKTL